MDVNQQIKRINLSLLSLSYPTIKDINFFRDYHDYVENSLKESIENVRNKEKAENKKEPRMLTMEIVENEAEIQKYSELRNIMRFSLFVSLYAYVEKIVINSCVVDGRKSKYKKIKSNEESYIGKAKEFLINEGYTDIDTIVDWDYIHDMRIIRNRFVHNGGKTTDKISKKSVKYDFEVHDEQIILGESFVTDFLEVIESFSSELVKIVYPAEDNRIVNFFNKYANK